MAPHLELERERETTAVVQYPAIDTHTNGSPLIRVVFDSHGVYIPSYSRERETTAVVQYPVNRERDTHQWGITTDQGGGWEPSYRTHLVVQMMSGLPDHTCIYTHKVFMTLTVCR